MFLMSLFLYSSLSSLSILITRVLNYISSRLLVSILFSSFSGILFCAFIWDMFLCFLILAASLCLFLSRAAMSSGLCRVALCSKYPVVSNSSTSPVTWAGSSKYTLYVGCVHPSIVVESWLLLAHQWERDLPLGQLAMKTGQDHCGIYAVQWLAAQSRSHFSGALVLLSLPFKYVACGGGWVVLHQDL